MWHKYVQYKIKHNFFYLELDNVQIPKDTLIRQPSKCISPLTTYTYESFSRKRSIKFISKRTPHTAQEVFRNSTYIHRES